jgi:hypothetical protein
LTSDKTVPPGGEGQIKVTFNPKGRPGVAHKTITVSTNDPDSPQVPLKLVANVVGALILDPPAVTLGDVDFGAGATVEVAASLRADVKGQIAEARGGSKDLKVERLPKPDAKGRTLFRITLDKATPIGPLRDVVTITSDSPEVPAARLVINGTVVGDVDFQPRTLSLAQPTGRIVLTRRPGKPPLRVVRAVSSAPDVTVALTEVKPGEQVQADVTIAEGKPRVRGKVTFTLDNPRQPEIVVPVSYATPGAPVVRGGLDRVPPGQPPGPRPMVEVK